MRNMKKTITTIDGIRARILSKNEINLLSRILNRFEKTFPINRKVEADMMYYDDDYIDIRVTFIDAEPYQDESYKMSRSTLSARIPIADKVDSIY